MKLFVTNVVLMLGVSLFAQQAPEYPNLNIGKFSDSGYTDANGVEHKILIKKPSKIYYANNRKYSLIPENDFVDLFSKKDGLLVLPKKDFFKKKK